MTDRFYPTELTCLCLVQCGDAVLVQQKIDAEFSGSLTFPGGHVKPGEVIDQAATRELHEECRLTITDWQPAGFVNFQYANGRRELIFLCAATLPAAHSTSIQPGTKNEGMTHWQPLLDLDLTQMNSVIQAVFETWQAGTVKELDFTA